MKTLVPVEDIGLGTFNHQPLVGVTDLSRTRVFHRREHGVARRLDTWTFDFAKHGLELSECRVCWPGGAR